MPYKDPEDKRAWRRRYRALNRDSLNEIVRLWRIEHPDRVLINSTRYHAERRLRDHGLL